MHQLKERMGKRFGRNQKRRMREQLAVARASCAALQKTEEILRSKICLLEKSISHVERVLGKNTAALPPNVVSRDSPAYGGFPFFETRYELKPWSVRSCRETIERRAFNINSAMCVIARSEQVAHIREMIGVHFIVNFSDKKCVYSVSESAIDSIDKESLIDHVSYSIASQLAKEFCK